MILALLKRAVKAALHEAAEEWALECGLPRAAVNALRAQRLACAAQAEARADAGAAAALGVEEDALDDAAGQPHALALFTPPDACPAPPSCPSPKATGRSTK
jgi:hypothetical protein